MRANSRWWRGAFSTMVLYAVGLHLIWAFCGLSSPTAFDSTALSALYRLAGTFTPLACFTVALMAVGAMFCHKPLRMVGLMLPQQALLVVSGIGAAKAVYLGSFPDGVIRSHEFILSDQAPALLAVLTHTCAILLATMRVVSDGT